MNAIEAIPILEDLNTTLPQVAPELRIQAVLLGIEALKDIENFRRLYPNCKFFLLPGETQPISIGESVDQPFTPSKKYGASIGKSARRRTHIPSL